MSKITFKEIIITSCIFSTIWYLTVGLLDYSVLKGIQKIDAVKKESINREWVNSDAYKRQLELDLQQREVSRQLELELIELQKQLKK